MSKVVYKEDYVKFKIGDNVKRYIYPNKNFPIGETCTILDIYHGPHGLYGTAIKDCGTKVQNLNFRYFEYYRVKYTKLAQKMYPNAVKEGDWLILK